MLVTHDPLDAMVLADRIVVVEDGGSSGGTPADVARRPRTGYVARLVGLNLYRGRAEGGTVTIGDGGATLDSVDSLDGEVFLAFAPSAVALYRTRPDGSPATSGARGSARSSGRATGSGAVVRAALRGRRGRDPGGRGRAQLSEGSSIWAAVKATETHVYPA